MSLAYISVFTVHTPTEKYEDILVVFSDTLLSIKKMLRFKKVDGKELTIETMEACGLYVLCIVGRGVVLMFV